MATHSRIAVLQEKSGQVKSVYCHSDGYLSGVGKMLLEYYNTYERANAIITLGDLSELYENLDPLPEAPEAYHFWQGVPEILKTHSFQKPQQDVTIAYHRDRKEKLNRQVLSTLEEFNEKGDFHAYNYLFKDAKWYAKSDYFSISEWVELTSEMINRNG